MTKYCPTKPTSQVVSVKMYNRILSRNIFKAGVPWQLKSMTAAHVHFLTLDTVATRLLCF